MARTHLCWVLLLCVGVVNSAVRISFPGCDRAGWKCIKVQPSPIRYELEYSCQNNDGVIFSLWNFNAPGEIKYLKVVNCTAVEIDLTCTNVGRQIERLYLKNIGVFNFTNLLYKDVAQLPEHVILEDIKSMPLIPEKTFKQMKHPLASAYRCAVNTKATDRIVFHNVNIGLIEQNAFYNLTEVKEFRWEKVSVNIMSPLAMHVEMEKDEKIVIQKGNFNQLDYKAFLIKSPKVLIQENKFNELPRNVIESTSFQFDFLNNTIKKVHSFAFILLSQDISFINNNFNMLKTSALQGIGPGLLENAFMSFGQLKFTYNFNNNTINHTDIGGLNPDWIAYKNVRSYINVYNNKLPCSCKELGWITLRGGLGDEFSSMMTFNAKYLDRNNKNLCLQSPCELPVTVMAGMYIKFGMCGSHEPLINWCKKYKPSSNDFGFKPSANLVLSKWRVDFPSAEQVEELSTHDVDIFENMYSLSQESSNKNYNFVKYSQGNPQESYFKMEKTGLMDIDPIDLLQGVTNSYNLQEVDAPNTEPSIPDIIFKDNEYLDKNNTSLKYEINNSNTNTTNTNTTNTNFNILKKEYEDNQKDFVKNTYEQWKAQRKKRMVYFKVYGNLVTLG